MKFRSLAPAIVSMAFAIVLPSTITAQKQNTPERRPGLTIRMETDLVVVDITATDKNGNYVRDLREDELEVNGNLRRD